MYLLCITERDLKVLITLSKEQFPERLYLQNSMCLRVVSEIILRGVGSNTFLVPRVGDVCPKVCPMGDGCRTKLGPGDEGNTGKPQDVLKLHGIALWVELLLRNYALGLGAGAKWFVLREVPPKICCPRGDNFWNSPNNKLYARLYTFIRLCVPLSSWPDFPMHHSCPSIWLCGADAILSWYTASTFHLCICNGPKNSWRETWMGVFTYHVSRLENLLVLLCWWTHFNLFGHYYGTQWLYLDSWNFWCLLINRERYEQHQKWIKEYPFLATYNVDIARYKLLSLLLAWLWCCFLYCRSKILFEYSEFTGHGSSVSVTCGNLLVHSIGASSQPKGSVRSLGRCPSSADPQKATPGHVSALLWKAEPDIHRNKLLSTNPQKVGSAGNWYHQRVLSVLFDIMTYWFFFFTMNPKVSTGWLTCIPWNAGRTVCLQDIQYVQGIHPE